MNAFCYQCEQTAKGTGCVAIGNCGKDPETSVLQDLLVVASKGIALLAHRAGQLGHRDPTLGRAVLRALFATVTNVNFDPERITAQLLELNEVLERARSLYQQACRDANLPMVELSGPAQFRAPASRAELLALAPEGSLQLRLGRRGTELAGLEELVLYGLKGTAAYAEHAAVLGAEAPAVYDELFRILERLASEQATADELLALALDVGRLNLTVMELLDTAHTTTYGHPVPTTVPVTAKKGKAILVSGHDLKDLELLLEQTEGRGINVYTHGEMLPAHAYPRLHKYPHLVGNWGGAWQDQSREFPQFPGAFLFTTNCIQAPKDSYRDRVFTSGQVAFPGLVHIQNHDFAPLIEAALAAPGFAEDEPERTILVGFGHHAVLGVADQVVAAVKSGAIKHFFLIGGCDGAKSGRDYYTEFAEKVPKDSVILTLACGKYRFNKLDFGTVGGLPRLLDIGQCNDAFSAIKIASALAQAFGTDVNGLPLSLIISWYEQKAVAVLLTLLSLGIRNIRLGPSLPAFVSSTVLEILVEKFAIQPIGTADADLAACLNHKERV